MSRQMPSRHWACGLALLVLAVTCLAVQRRVAVRAELMAHRVSLDAVEGAQPTSNPALEPARNWWARVVSNSAAQVLWPHHKLLPLQGNQKVLLNPGELSGELKDPDDPWGYSHPRCRGLPTCSSSTSSPAVTRHQREMQRFLDATKASGASARAKRQGLQLLNPGELSGELKDPDDPWGYSHPRCRGLPTCSDSTSSPAITKRTSLTQRHKAKTIKAPNTKSLDAILAQEHASLAHIRGAKRQGLQLLNPGELSGELKDPDDPWGYSHPRCRGLPTCSDSVSSPAVKRHQGGLLKFAHGNYYTNIARQGMHRLGADGTNLQKSTPHWLYTLNKLGQ